MFKDKNRAIFYLISLVFIVINLIFITYDFYYIAFLPVILLFLFISIVSLDRILLVIVFFTPLSVQLKDIIPGVGFNLSLPTEPLLIGVMFLVIFKILYEGNFDKKVLVHPVSIAIYIYLFWLFLTSLTSTMPGVSLKFFVSKLWFVVPMFFLTSQLFRNRKNIDRFNWIYIISLFLVAVYTNYNLSKYGFNNQAASNWVVRPFFSDHTSYGAMLVMFLFPLLYFSLRKTENLFLKIITRSLLLLFLIAIVLSYTRAAWLSLFAGIGLLVIVKMKIKIKYIIIIACTGLVLFFALYNKIFQGLEKNQTESSGKISEHIESMANISTDASNLERLNRWKCAIRMFKEKPFLGWGPGTYMFKYAPFQHSSDRSIISTNFGDLGNAHSEYLGPLAESGIVGLGSVILLIFMVFKTGYNVYHRAKSEEIKEFSLYIIAGLATYFLHGVLNNFFDSDKAAVPVWGLIAMLVSLDIYYKEQKCKV